MNRKILVIFITLLFLISSLSVSVTACYLPIKTTEVVAVTETIQAPATSREIIVHNNFFDDVDGNIRFDVEDGMFPQSWINADQNPKAESLVSAERERSKKIILAATYRLPRNVINNNLSIVYALNSLSLSGITLGGTWNPNPIGIVYIINKGEEKGYSDLAIEHEFYHELMHILDSNISIDKNGWKKLNPDGFVYYVNKNVSFEDFLKEGNPLFLNPELGKQGFANKYCQYAINEEISEIAAYILSRDPDFLQILKDAPILQKKVSFFIDYCKSIDSSFNFDDINSN